jgi:hypothetical protein
MKLAGHVACMEETINAWIILVEEPERERKLGSSRPRWEYNNGYIKNKI